MADLAPLRALTYRVPDLAAVVAPPYDVIGPDERRALGARSAHNIVHVDLPEGDGDARYANAARLLAEWRAAGVLVLDDAPAIYVYAQTFLPEGASAPVTRRGFFALVRAEPYERRVVLPHERTLSGPKEDRFKLFKATRAALSPVFLLYQDPSGAIRGVLDGARDPRELTTEDGVTHRIARVADGDAIAAVVRALRDRSLLIADGHHRYETTLRYGGEIDAELAKAGKPVDRDASHHWVLSFLCDGDDPGLQVFPTHRLVHGIAGFDRAAMLARVRETFDVRETRADDVPALVAALAAAGRTRASVAAVFPDGAAAVLTLRADVDPARHPSLGARPPVLRTTDVVVLHAAILEDVLGISQAAQAAQTNLAYVKSAKDAVVRVRRGEGDVLFLMNATPVADVRRACEAGEVMPQKSTFFYPKVLTGLLVYPFA